MLRPDLEVKECAVCRKYFIDEFGRVMTRNGEPLKRPRPPNCNACTKGRMGLEEWNVESRGVVQAWRLAKVTGIVPGGLEAAVVVLQETEDGLLPASTALSLARVMDG